MGLWLALMGDGWDFLGFKLMGSWLALMGDGGRLFRHQNQRHCHKMTNDAYDIEI